MDSIACSMYKAINEKTQAACTKLKCKYRRHPKLENKAVTPIWETNNVSSMHSIIPLYINVIKMLLSIKVSHDD